MTAAVVYIVDDDEIGLQRILRVVAEVHRIGTAAE